MLSGDELLRFLTGAALIGKSIILRYLGIDYGTKRIGLAVGDSDGRIATPLAVIERIGDAARDAYVVMVAGEDYSVDAYVLGIPYNMDDTVGPQAKLTQAFGKVLADRSRKEIIEWDERLSTRAADEYLSERDLTHKKKKARRDALAAQIILQSYLDSLAAR